MRYSAFEIGGRPKWQGDVKDESPVEPAKRTVASRAARRYAPPPRWRGSSPQKSNLARNLRLRPASQHALKSYRTFAKRKRRPQEWGALPSIRSELLVRSELLEGAITHRKDLRTERACRDDTRDIDVQTSTPVSKRSPGRVRAPRTADWSSGNEP